MSNIRKYIKIRRKLGVAANFAKLAYYLHLLFERVWHSAA